MGTWLPSFGFVVGPHPRVATPKAFRVGKALGIAGLAVFALYLIAGNLLIQTGLLRGAINVRPNELVLEYESAYTLFPGHVVVKGLAVRFQDSTIQFALAIDEATAQIALLEFGRRRFHVNRVRARGVSWRMLHKVSQIEGEQLRLAAFPRIEGFEWPPVRTPVAAGPVGTGEGLWSVQLDGVEAQIRELWILEYRYLGAGLVSGAFELRPMKSVWVGPAALELQEGTLSTGQVVASKNFRLKVQCQITPFDIATPPDLRILRSITASIQLSAQVDDVSAARLYFPGLEAQGEGTLAADVRLTNGRLASGTVLEARLPGLRLSTEQGSFDGTINTTFRLALDSHGAEVPIGHLALEGTVRVATSKDVTVSARVSGATADLSLATADLTEGLELNWLHARVEEARCDDARVLTAAAAAKAPFIAAAALGSGPLVAEGTADITRAGTVVRLAGLRLGAAKFTGAVTRHGQSWNGAAEGTVAAIPVGLRLTNGAVEVLPFVTGGWLTGEFQRAGIAP